jgi:hypothetical protein
MRRRLVLAAFVLGLGAVGAAAAGLNRNWSSHASGSLEIPARDTRAQGQVIFQLSDGGTALEYKLIASNIENVIASHIHVGTPDVNGPVGVFLFGPAAPGGGRTVGVLAEGTITAANFVGPLAGMTIDDLVTLLDAGGAYVNVHTNDGQGDINTGPGDFPGGEIRANVR